MTYRRVTWFVFEFGLWQARGLEDLTWNETVLSEYAHKGTI